MNPHDADIIRARSVSDGYGESLAHASGSVPRPAWQVWTCRAVLAVLPLVLALGYYYRPALRGGLEKLPVEYDAGFYIYLMARSTELNGQWWKLGTDELLGHPYQTAIAKHPGLYEGVDLLLISAVTGRFLPPVLNYHAMILVVLLFNGWVTAWLVRRLTGSYFWAAVAIVLITLNASTGLRINGHIHLVKYGWVLLTVWCFLRYLDAPSLGRGLLLGLVAALMLQGSFYMAFLLAVVLGLWWLGCLAAGKLGRDHFVPTCAALLTALALGAALTFPVWTIGREVALTEEYYVRERQQLWHYGSDLWQYFVSPNLDFGLKLQAGRSLPCYEGWNYAGMTVLLALGTYLVLRLRGRLVCADTPFVDRLMGLIGLSVLLSLAGGPSVFLFSVVSSLRSYGRAGLIALALWSVVAPVVLYALCSRIGRRSLRAALCAAILALALYDGNVVTHGHLSFRCVSSPLPAWVEWAAQQPADTRLAVFTQYPLDPDTNPRMWDALYHRVVHRRPVLNCAEYTLLAADLKVLGASADKLNPNGLRSVLALGYNTLIFHPLYLKYNPWITALPWLEHAETLGEWQVFRPNAQLAAMPAQSMQELLASQKGFASPTRVPAASWITDRFDLEQPVAVTDRPRVQLAWANADRKLVSRPAPALLQQVYTANHPAYCVCTPTQPGSYFLVFLDERQNWLASRHYEVTADLPICRLAAGDTTPTVGGLTIVTDEKRTEPVRVTLTNATANYLQAHVFRNRRPRSLQLTPTAIAPLGGSLVLAFRFFGPQSEKPLHEHVMVLPCDLPPHSQRAIEIPEHLLPKPDSQMRVEIRPHFQALVPQVVAAGQAHVRLELGSAVAHAR